MYIIACFSISKESSADFAISLASVTGILSGKKTLLLDFGDVPNVARERLGLVSCPDTASLLGKHLDSDAVDLPSFVTPFPCPKDWNPTRDGRFFDVLPGPPSCTSGYADLLRDIQAARLIEAIFSEADDRQYEFLIVNGDHVRARIWAGFVLENCAAVYVSPNNQTEINTEDWTASPISIGKYIRLPGYYLDDVPRPPIFSYLYTSNFLFPRVGFLSVLETKNKEYRKEIGKCAVHLLRTVFPGFKKSLTYPDGRSLNPNIQL